jgi:hypothetical protein
MEFTDFHMALTTLMVLDMQELVDAGAIADRDYAAWDAFQADPARWFLKADDDVAAAIWKAVWRRRALDVMVGAAPESKVVSITRKRAGKR